MSNLHDPQWSTPLIRYRLISIDGHLSTSEMIMGLFLLIVDKILELFDRKLHFYQMRMALILVRFLINKNFIEDKDCIYK
jgi:hypothetical protein